MDGLRVINICSAQQNNHKNIQQFLVSQYLYTTSFETLTVFPDFSKFHLH